ncbi:hypothetical protein M758_10G025100 [Ceratodon purpureus]|nr:hypothetical protein M758_10G025100 [Ceratodon purpureus]
MHSMAASTSAMLVRPDANSVSFVRSVGEHGSLRMRPQGLALRRSKVQVCLRRKVCVRASVRYRSVFLAPMRVVVRRRPVYGNAGIREFKSLGSSMVRAGAGGNLEDVADDGSGEARKELDESLESEVERLAAEDHAHENLLTVEEIEVPGLSQFSDTVDSDSVEVEMDVVHQSTRQQPKLVKILRKIVRFLSGVKDKEDALLELSSSAKQKKLRWNPLGFLNGSTPSATEKLRAKVFNGLRRAEDDFFAFSSQLGKFTFIMGATGAILATGFQLSGGEAYQEQLLWGSWLAGIVLGSMIGAGQVLEGHGRRGRRNVVITGSTRGLGKALAREFLRAGDNVFITSRSLESVNSTVLELQREVDEMHRDFLLSEDLQVDTIETRSKKSCPRVVGIPCDVSKSEDVQALSEAAVREFGNIHLWINNAGMNKGFKPLVEFSDEEVAQIVSTNLTGSLICTREAIRVMKKQPKGGHIFNMDGAGSGGTSTPLTAVYGATKCGLRQLSASLMQECKRSRVGIHTASPGMVLTDLLLSGATRQNKQMFNIICEQPETVAQALVPGLRTVKGTGKAVNYLTPPRIILAILNGWFRRGRWFDQEGRAVYAAEADRLRLWAGREKSPVTAAMEMVPSGAWVTLFSSSVLCAYVILSTLSGGDSSGI